jgi:hypothetical protein
MLVRHLCFGRRSPGDEPRPTTLIFLPSSELSVSLDDPLDSCKTSLSSNGSEGEEFKSPLPTSLQSSLSPSSRPETMLALDIMRSALSGSSMSFSPMHQQQVIAEIKADPSFIDECQLTPQKVPPAPTL